MQTGRDPVHSSDKPRDVLDRYQTATCSLLSGDSWCAGWIQTLGGATGMGRGTNRHAGPIVAVKLDICETWQVGLYPPPLGGWATDKLYDWADIMVHAAPSRCCVVVGGDLNEHVGYMRHPERDALTLERERPWRDVESIMLCMRTATESVCPSFVKISTR